MPRAPLARGTVAYRSGGCNIPSQATDITSCAVSVNSIGTLQAAGYSAGQNIYVQVSTAAGTPVDGYFQLAVTC